MQFSGKFGKTLEGSRPRLREILDPPLKSLLIGDSNGFISYMYARIEILFQKHVLRSKL